MKYRRIPGGEKTKKSGIPWNEEELTKVYELFIALKGIGIHERNPKIQELAKRLDRSVRSTEAQLLMFRALSKGGNYSRKNMNKLCETIWNKAQPLQIKPKMAMNNFLLDLLSYEQDAATATSKPSNWEDEPLLNVRTKLDTVVEDLANQFLTKSETARWHFFIGAPGNGKSAAIGKLYRVLKKEGVTFRDRHKILIDFNENPLPYEICCFRGENKFSFAYLAQDASIVQNEFKTDKNEINAALDLIELMNHVFEEKKNLVVCANRGILEEVLLNEKRFGSKTLYSRINNLYKNDKGPGDLEFSSAKDRDYQSLSFSKTVLDNKSLLYEDKGFFPFQDLVIKATEDKYWKYCKACDSRSLCPFYNNAQYLKNSGKANFINIVRKAELFSGKSLVFREALAMLSFILAGCSDDYINYNGHPCQWVTDMIRQKKYLTLLGRRIYMTLFSAYSPYGLIDNEKLRNEQVTFILKIRSNHSVQILRELKETNRNLSTNFGVKRFFSISGIFREIDPLFNIEFNEIDSSWSTSSDWLETQKQNSDLLTELEFKLIELFKSVEDHLIESDKDIHQKQKWYNIWSTSIIYRLAALQKSLTGFNKELSSLATYFENREDTIERKEEFDKLADELFKTIQSTEDSIYLNQNVRITGSFYNNFKPVISYPTAQDINDLCLEFSFENSKSFKLPILPKTLVWLMRKYNYSISNFTFPTELLETAITNQVKVARDLAYNTEENIKLKIGSSQTNYEVKRYRNQLSIKKHE